MEPRNDDFAYLAHDLSQVLWAIQGRARTLALELIPPASDAVELIAEDAAAAAAMLADRAEARADLLTVVQVAWRQTIDRAMAMYLPVDDCKLLGPDTPATVAMPAPVLRRILGNLFANAVEARSGDVTVTCKSLVEDDCLQLVVCDDGPGIEPTLRPRIFAPGESTSMSAGRGLGLPGARTLARNWGGELVCRETSIGACFVLTIPLALDSLSGEAPAGTLGGDSFEAPSKIINDDPASLSVLVVDDDPSVREMLQNLLTVLGHRPAVVGHYDAALSLCAAGSYDAALIDLGLPGRSGRELAEQLREHDQALAVILMTGWGRERELTEPPSGYVDLTGVKPLDLPQLRQLLNRAAQLTAARRGGCKPEV